MWGWGSHSGIHSTEIHRTACIRTSRTMQFSVMFSNYVFKRNTPTWGTTFHRFVGGVCVMCARRVSECDSGRRQHCWVAVQCPAPHCSVLLWYCESGYKHDGRDALGRQSVGTKGGQRRRHNFVFFTLHTNAFCAPSQTDTTRIMLGLAEEKKTQFPFAPFARWGHVAVHSIRLCVALVLVSFQVQEASLQLIDPMFSTHSRRVRAFHAKWNEHNDDERFSNGFITIRVAMHLLCVACIPHDALVWLFFLFFFYWKIILFHFTILCIVWDRARVCVC